MTNKEMFIKEIESLLEEAKDCHELIFEELSEGAQAYFDKLKTQKDSLKEKVDLTEKGKQILEYMRDNKDECKNSFISSQIAEGLFISARGVPGSMQKLVKEGYVSKDDSKPLKYSITEKGLDKVK